MLADLILDAWEQKIIPEQFVYDLCHQLYRRGMLNLRDVRRRDRVLWAKLKKELTNRYGGYDFTLDHDRDAANMFIKLAGEGFFSDAFMEELRAGLCKAAKGLGLARDTRRQAGYILDHLNCSKYVRIDGGHRGIVTVYADGSKSSWGWAVDRTKTVQKNGKRRTVSEPNRG